MSGIFKVTSASSTAGGLNATKISTGSFTVTSGKTLTNPELSIAVGHTYTVNSNGLLLSVNTLTVNGTLTVDSGGESAVLNYN